MDLTQLKELRLSKGLTQAELSKLVGVSVNAYRNWEQLTSEPKEENLEKLIEILKEDKMETRKARLLVNTRRTGQGGTTFRATLPTTWIRKMGLSEEQRNLILKFEEDAIVIKKDEIFLVVTEDGNIILDITEEETQARDQIIYESDIEDLVETELQESIHEIDIEEFENEVDFFLQNAIREDYANYYIDTQLDTLILTEEAKSIIQEEVIERIKDRLK